MANIACGANHLFPYPGCRALVCKHTSRNVYYLPLSPGHLSVFAWQIDLSMKEAGLDGVSGGLVAGIDLLDYHMLELGWISQYVLH